jgi:hypothetical protein
MNPKQKQCAALAHRLKNGDRRERRFLGAGSPALVVERDDGMFQVGLHEDAAGPFQTRDFAQAIVDGEGPHALAS